MGARVFQGAVSKSPLPVWQWQSMIIGRNRWFYGPRGRAARALRRSAQKPDARLYAAIEIRQVQFFVGRVDPVVGQGKAHEHGWNPEDFVEHVHHGKGAARAY